MKIRVALFSLLVLILSAGMARLAAQENDQEENEKSAITVKKTDVVNGVVVVSITKATKAYTLQCNQGAPNCNPLKSGKYQMVELPPNHGMYDCKDVEVYPEATGKGDTDQKLGEYCLVE